MSTEKRRRCEPKRRRIENISVVESVIGRSLPRPVMDDIHREASLSRCTQPLHVKGKIEGNSTTAPRDFDGLPQRETPLFSGAHEYHSLDLIRKMGKTYLNFEHENPNYFTALIYYESLSDIEKPENSTYAEQCDQNRREALNFMIRTLQIGMQDGSIDDRYEPRELTTIIFVSTRGLTTMAHASERGHHFELLDKMEISMRALFRNFSALLVKGMASNNETENKSNKP